MAESDKKQEFLRQADYAFALATQWILEDQLENYSKNPGWFDGPLASSWECQSYDGGVPKLNRAFALFRGGKPYVEYLLTALMEYEKLTVEVRRYWPAHGESQIDKPPEFKAVCGCGDW